MSDNNPRLTYHGQNDNDEGYEISSEQHQKGKPSVKPKSSHPDIVDTTDITATYNRPGNAYNEGKFAQAEKYVEGKIPKTGVHTEAGVKGPNASAGAEVSTVGVGAMARAEIASASAKAGPVGVKVGLGFDTGASAGVDGVEAKVLGTGFSIGKKNSVSVLGSEVSCSVM